MKRTLKIFTLLALLAIGGSINANASGLDLKSGASTLGNLIEGVFSTSNLDIDDLAGEWTANGSAVKFQSENLLNKAGGLAAAAAIEAKLDPYYKKLGLEGAVVTIQTDGSFTMNVKKMNLKGQIEKLDNGNFSFKFQVLGMNIGAIETYVSKSSNQMDVMFDADKLIKIVELVGKVSGMKTVKAISGILKSYDGICVGFKMTKTGSVEGEKKSGLGGLLNGVLGGNSNSSKKSDAQDTDSTKTETKSGLGGLLNGVLGGGNNETSTKKQESNASEESQKKSTTNSILDIFKKK
ncbi:MAG: DUF4923 family protein [Bacteroidales bacterium]|nr:DUF4923 family protein [Bacteroidales bacterium]MBD5220992.1 DUF4923 family protein [Bacteroidales bacterium]